MASSFSKTCPPGLEAQEAREKASINDKKRLQEKIAVLSFRIPEDYKQKKLKKKGGKRGRRKSVNHARPVSGASGSLIRRVLNLPGSRKAAALSELDSAAMPQVITAETTGLSVQ